MGEYKKQHTVTRKYLEGFASDQNHGKFCQYKKSDGTFSWVDPKDATTANYIYSIQKPDGSWNHAVEHGWSVIESDAIPIIPLICRQESLNDKQRYDFALHVAAMFLRPRHTIEHSLAGINNFISKADNALAFIKEHRSKLVQSHGEEEVSSLEIKIQNGDWEGSEMGAKIGRFRAWVDCLPTKATILVAMKWELWKSNKKNVFLTSDSPVSTRRNGNWHDPGIVGIAREDLNAEVYFPLDSRNFLVMKHSGNECRRSATKTRVIELNKLTIRMANKFIHSPFESGRIASLILDNNKLPAPLTGRLLDAAQ